MSTHHSNNNSGLFDTPVFKAQEAQEIKSFRKIMHFMRKLIETRNIYTLSEVCLEFLLDFTETQRGFVLLADSPYHHIAATEGFESGNLTNKAHPDAQCYLKAVEAVQTPTRIFQSVGVQKNGTDPTNSQNINTLVLQPVLHNTFCFPLRSHSQCLGVIYLETQNVSPSVHWHDRSSFHNLLSLIALAFFNAHHSKMQETDLVSTRKLLNQQQNELEIQKYSFDSFIGISRKKHELFQLLQKTISSHATITLTGESGVGKELIAHIIHYNSPRRHKRFIAFNCAAIPETLLESELFGYVKGAFTGADEDHVGLFVKAHGGTLFLDEVAEMPLTVQAKLLRVLQDQEVCQIGNDKPITVDVRIICTSNNDLAESVAQGLFREDLLYRINVVTLTIPPLRERREDIPLLAEHALATFAAENNVPEKELADDTKKILTTYPWPGNVRELFNVMHNLAIFVEGPVIRLSDIINRKGLLTHPMIESHPDAVHSETARDLGRMIDEGQLSLSEAKREFERLEIQRALKLYNGQITSASEHLKMPRPQVSRLVKKYGLKG